MPAKQNLCRTITGSVFQWRQEKERYRLVYVFQFSSLSFGGKMNNETKCKVNIVSQVLDESE